MKRFTIGLGLAVGLIAMQAVSAANAASQCGAGRVYSSSLGKCIPNAAGTRVFISHGCPYNLDKVCYKNSYGRLVNCRCVS